MGALYALAGTLSIIFQGFRKSCPKHRKIPPPRKNIHELSTRDISLSETYTTRTRLVQPLRYASTSAAALRPSAMAHTTRDWPRRISPAAKTFSTVVAKPPSAVRTVSSQATPKASHTPPAHPAKPVAAIKSPQGSVSPSVVVTAVSAPFSTHISMICTPNRLGSPPNRAAASSWA